LALNLIKNTPLIIFLVPERPDFPQEEENVLEYWKKIDAFK